MHIFDLTIPGTWLVHRDSQERFELRTMINHLQHQFYEANVALNLFSQFDPEQTNLSDWEQDFRRKSELRRIILAQRGTLENNMDDIDFEVDVHFKREQWSQGIMPIEFLGSKRLIYARAFLYALDRFDKFLTELSKSPGAHAELKILALRVIATFPHLRKVRNSSQHLEDRARGLDQYKRPLKLRPVNNGFVTSSHGTLILDSLNGSKYGATMHDGHYGEIDVSIESMTRLQEIMQDVLDSFIWKGAKTYLPK